MSTQANSKWDEQRLTDLIKNRIEESAELEFKGAGALRSDQKAKEEITKDVSAMANASGGTIIYGISEYSDEARKHLPERIDPIDRTQFSREWLDQIISQIRPKIADLRIEPVELSSATNHVAYVVEIPKGSTAHQALTLHYHRRYNFEALRMLDHEIRDVMNRRTHPKIVVSARLIGYPQANSDGVAGRLIFKLDNQSDVLARHVLLTAHVPIIINDHPVSYGADTILDDTERGRGLKLKYSNALGPPLFPRTHISPWFDFKVGGELRVRGTQPLSEIYQYSVFADSMPALRGEFTFDSIYEKMAAQPWVDVKNVLPQGR